MVSTKYRIMWKCKRSPLSIKLMGGKNNTPPKLTKVCLLPRAEICCWVSDVGVWRDAHVCTLAGMDVSVLSILRRHYRYYDLSSGAGAKYCWLARSAPLRSRRLEQYVTVSWMDQPGPQASVPAMTAFVGEIDSLGWSLTTWLKQYLACYGFCSIFY